MDIDFEHRVAEALEAERVPGLALALVEGRGVTWSSGFGVTDVDRPQPVDEHTVFRVGSVSKPFVATAILRLVELGELSLDRPVREWVDEVPDEWPATIRMLLSHTSGLRPDTVDADAPAAPLDLDGLVAEGVPRRLPLGPPPERPTYSNLGVSVAALAAERATGRPFEELVAEYVFRPAGMTSSRFGLPAEPGRLAAPHDLGEDGLAVTTFADAGRGYAPAKGAFSTAYDMARFAIAHLHDGSIGGVDILQPESVALMHKRVVAHSRTTGSGFALGLEVFEYKGTRVLGHTGDVGAYKTWMLFVPHDRIAVVAVCNRPPMYRLTPLPWRILDRVLGLPAYRFDPSAWPGRWPRWTGDPRTYQQQRRTIAAALSS